MICIILLCICNFWEGGVLESRQEYEGFGVAVKILHKASYLLCWSSVFSSWCWRWSKHGFHCQLFINICGELDEEDWNKPFLSTVFFFEVLSLSWMLYTTGMWIWGSPDWRCGYRVKCSKDSSEPSHCGSGAQLQVPCSPCCDWEGTNSGCIEFTFQHSPQQIELRTTLWTLPVPPRQKSDLSVQQGGLSNGLDHLICFGSFLNQCTFLNSSTTFSRHGD